MKSLVSQSPPFPCRFDDVTRKKLQNFSDKTGIPKALLIRHGVKQALLQFEHKRQLSFAEDDLSACTEGRV